MSSFCALAAQIDKDSAADWNGSRRSFTGYDRGNDSRGFTAAAESYTLTHSFTVSPSIFNSWTMYMFVSPFAREIPRK
ncbi:hypothetical protein HGO21_29345 [Acinetobacter sp. CUI P1]|nr:hypothetical protein [Acinetobacter sp. CUI P1]